MGVLKLKPVIEFVSYDGRYPCLCAGNLILRINGIERNLGDILHSGGSCYYIGDADYIAGEGDWYINEDELPEDLRQYKDEIEKIANDNVVHGCCGGCI